MGLVTISTRTLQKPHENMEKCTSVKFELCLPNTTKGKTTSWTQVCWKALREVRVNPGQVFHTNCEKRTMVNTHHAMHRNQQGVCHTMALRFTLTSKAKEE